MGGRRKFTHLHLGASQYSGPVFHSCHCWDFSESVRWCGVASLRSFRQSVRGFELPAPSHEPPPPLLLLPLYQTASNRAKTLDPSTGPHKYLSRYRLC